MGMAHAQTPSSNLSPARSIRAVLAKPPCAGQSTEHAWNRFVQRIRRIMGHLLWGRFEFHHSERCDPLLGRSREHVGEYGAPGPNMDRKQIACCDCSVPL